MQRRQQRVLLRDPAFDRPLLGRERRDELVLLPLGAGELSPASLQGGPEVPDLPDDTRVERRDALRGVEARHHVVEAPRAEDHLERRALAGLVERDEPLRHRALAGREVVARDAALLAVLAHVLLDVSELELRQVVALNRRLERAPRSAFSLASAWAASACFERIEGSPNAGSAATSAKQIPARTYGASPCLRRRPLVRGRDGRTGWGRYVTRHGPYQGFRTAVNLSRPRRGPQNHVHFGTKRSISGPGLWYGPAPCSGRHTGRRGACLRPPPSPSPSSPFRRSALPTPVGPRRPSVPRRRRSLRRPGLPPSASSPSTSSSRRQRRGCSRCARRRPTLRARRDSLAHQLTIARRSATIAQQRLGIHVRALYERGDVSTLEVVFGARNLDDALTSIDDLHRMANQDAEVLGAVKATRSQLSRAARAPRRPGRRSRGGDPRCCGDRRLAQPIARPSAAPTSHRCRGSASSRWHRSQP